MFIAIVFVIFVDGQAFQDYATAPSREACVKLNAELEKTLKADKRVAGYHHDCIDVKSLKKPGKDA